jgi:hypothetical protein
MSRHQEDTFNGKMVNDYDWQYENENYMTIMTV